MKTRLLILTAGFGEGHNAAARALMAAGESVFGEGYARVADPFALASPRFNAAARRGYILWINRAPKLWSRFYDWLDHSRSAAPLLGMFRAEKRALAALIEQEAPGVIACTYPVYAFMLAALAREQRLRVPFFNVVTDSITINSLWWRAGAAGWFLPNEDSAEVMQRAGLPRDRLRVLGFPVSDFFKSNAAELSPPDLGAGATPRVLCIINSGTRGAIETVRRLLSTTDWEITCTVGRDEALQHKLTVLAVGRKFPTKILGWTHEIPRLLMTHHVVISKAGGATTQEALAARCPMIVNQIVPGQEEGNYELLRRYGVGALAESPAAVVAELERAFKEGGRVWREWRQALAPLSRPDAAQQIVEALEQSRLALPVAAGKMTGAFPQP